MKNMRWYNANKKYNLFFNMIVMTLMLSGCSSGYMFGLHDPAHGIYSISQSELNSEIEHFEQTKEISCSDIPEIYDISRLRVGSMVDADIKVIRGNNENHEMFYTTIILNDIETTEEGEKILATTYPAEVLSNYKPDELKKVICKKVEGQTSKIIDFKMVGQEDIKVADKPIACKVYKFNKITAGTTSGYYSLTNDFTTLWVSDEIPFGIVKDETKRLVVSETFPTTIGSKTFTNRIKAERLINFEVTGFDYATVVSPMAIIQNIKKNGLGDRFFIKDIPLLRDERIASCAIAKIEGTSEMSCGGKSQNIFYTGHDISSIWRARVPDIKGLDYVALASPESVEKLLMRDADSSFNKMFNDIFGNNKLIILYPREISLTIPPGTLTYQDIRVVFGKKTGREAGDFIVDYKSNIANPLGDGSIHKIYGSVKMGQYMFINEGGVKFNMLNFGIIKPYGYVYLQGKGKVILPDGKEVKLGYGDSR